MLFEAITELDAILSQVVVNQQDATQVWYENCELMVRRITNDELS
jgi:hypothetical protein